MSEASENGEVDAVHFLLENGTNVNITDKYSDKTALMCTSEWGCKEVVNMLINADADVHIKDTMNRTAILYVAAKVILTFFKPYKKQVLM